ncbi:MAG: hypothetical protein M3540_09535 [Actinomycetota bacterium]|nr:hypothetical protein [Actinomycetota bacterium]
MRRDWWTVLGAVAIGAVGEMAGVLFADFLPVALAAAVLFLVGWYFVRLRSVVGIAIVGILSTLELVGLPFYERDDAVDWVTQAAFLILGLVGSIAAIGALRNRAED